MILSMFSTFATFLINIILWTFIITIYSVPLLFGFSIRLIINYIAKCRHTNLIPLSPNDILLIRQIPQKQSVVCGGVILKLSGPLDFVKFQGLFREIFLSPENYSRYINLYCDITSFCGYLFKRILYTEGDENFDYNLHEHFQYKVLSAENDDPADGNTNINFELSKWFQTKFKEDLPLWQVLCLYCEKNDESYLAIKGHHGLMDGYSFVHILDKLTGTMSSNVPKNSDAVENNFQLLFSLPNVALRYLLRHFWFPDNLSTITNKLPYLTNVEMLLGTFATTDVEIIKQIRRKLKVRFPSIIYSLQVGALRRFLMEMETKIKENELPKVMMVSTSFPVKNHPRNTLTNHWSGGTIKVPLRQCSPKQRLLETNESFEQMTGNEGPYLIWRFVSYLPWLIPSPILYWMSFGNLSLYRYRTSISVIPQSNTQYYLMGQLVHNIYHAPLMKDCFPRALLLGCSSSHGNQIDFSLFGHPHLFPNQEGMDKIMGYFRDEIQELMRECELDKEFNLNWR